MTDGDLELKAFLQRHRARLDRSALGFPGEARRVSGLSQADVAEIAGVSERWYAIFESGASKRRFSAPFVERVADALQLDAEERLTLYRLAFPAVATVASNLEIASRRAERGRFTRVRDLARALRDAEGELEAAARAVDALHSFVDPDGLTAASIQLADGRVCGYASGPRSTGWLRESDAAAIAAHAGLERSESALGHLPFPDGLDAGTLSLTFQRVRADGASYAYEIATDRYRRLNGRLRLQSVLIAPLYRGDTYCGVIGCRWIELRRPRRWEIDALEMIVAILSLALPFTELPVRPLVR